jgi:prepilin-type N-terminal cleavage/methylation domain-containing protein
MGCAHNKYHEGFTLVEIAIVMIIIGLLIGGTFGGLKLVENMNVNKAIQDLKAIESAALTFKNTYGRIPGDLNNPSVRISGCTTPPCSTGGNGNRRLDSTDWLDAITATDERFTFWSHLQAAELLSIGTQNTTDMNFGRGQPESTVGGGYRIFVYTGAFFVGGARPVEDTNIMMGVLEPSAVLNASTGSVSKCGLIASLDRKADDGLVYDGFLKSWCSNTSNLTDTYDPALSTGATLAMYNLKGF